MKRFSFFLALLLFLSFTTIVCAEPVLIQSIDYLGVNEQSVNGVGVEGRGSILNFYQWQNGKLLNDTILTTGRNITNPQIVQSNNNQKAVAYLQGSKDVLRLNLLTFYNGIWKKVNHPLDQNDKVSVGLHDLCMSENLVYLAYTQGDELAIIKYDLLSESPQTLYRENLNSKRILTLTLTRVGSNPVFAYTYENQGQIQLQITRLSKDGVADWRSTVDQVNGYDLVGNDHHLYLAYDQKVNLESNVFFYEIGNGQNNLLSQFKKQDSTPFGIKLMLTDNDVNLLYRDNGVAAPYDLFVRKFSGRQMMAPRLLTVAGRWAELNDLRDNLYIVDSSHLLLASQVQNPMVLKQKPGYQIIDLEQAVPETFWTSGKAQKHVQKQTVKQTVNLQSQELSLVPGAVVTDLDGNMFILDRSAGKVCKIDSQNSRPTYWKASEMDEYEFVDVAISPEKEFFIVDRENHRIVIFDQQGKFARYWGNPGNGSGQFFNPVGVLFDSKANLYILDAGNHRIQKFDSEGRMLMEWGSRGSNAGQFINPTGMAIDTNNQIYVADTGNHRIQIFHTDGTFVNQFGRFGRDAGQMIEPVDLAIHKGEIYVVDQGNSRVQVFDMNLQYEFEFSNSATNSVGLLTHIHLDQAGNIYLTDKGNGTVQRFSRDLNLTGEWYGQKYRESFQQLETGGTITGLNFFLDIGLQQLKSNSMNFNLAEQTGRILIGWDADSNYLYFIDILHHAVVQVAKTGKTVRTIGSYGNQPGKLNHPQGIAVDSTGNIYVADTGNHRIQVFNSSGQYLREWGHYGLGQGEYVAPISVSFSDANFLVVDQGTNRIQSVSSMGRYNNEWAGSNGTIGKLSVQEYLAQNASSEKIGLDLVIDPPKAPGGLTNDNYPCKVKTWDLGNVDVRYVIDMYATTNPTGAYSFYLFPIELSGVTGKYYLHYQYLLMDPRGEYDGPVKHVYAYLDNTPPSSISITPNTTSPAKSVTFSWSASDVPVVATNIQSYRFMVTDLPPAQWTSTQLSAWNALTYSSTATNTTLNGVTGTKYITVEAKDYAGNVSQRYTSSIYLDNTVPAISNCNAITNDGTTLQVTITATDNFTPAARLKYRFSMDTNPTATLTGTYVLGTSFSTAYQASATYLHIQVQDEAGNESAVFNYALDKTAPTIGALSNYNTPVKAHTWTWAGTDNAGAANLKYRYSFSENAPSDPNGVFGTATSAAVPLSNGKIYINLQARDAMGNLSPVYHYYVNMDNTKPVIGSCGIVADGSGNWIITPNATDNMSVAANIKYRYAINPSQTYTVTGTYAAGSSFTAQALSGTQYLHLQAIDQAGNESTVYDMLIDTTAPVISPLSNYDTPVKAHTWTWTGTDNSGVAPTYRWSMNQTAADTPSGTFSAAISAAVPSQTGKVYIHLQAKDATGNLSPVYHYYVNMDNTKPVIGSCGIVADGSGNWIITPNATDNMSAAANIKYRYAINPSQTYTVTGTYAAGSSFTAQALSGTQYLYLQAIDQAGNESTVYDMLIDTTAPVISPLSNYDTPVKAHTWTWTGTDNSGVAPTYRWSMNQTAADTPSGTFSAATSAAVPAQTGKVYIHLQAKDATGNLSPVYHYYVNMDNTKPVIGSCGIVADGSGNWTITPNATDNMSVAANIKYRYAINPSQTYTVTGTYAAGSSFTAQALSGTQYLHLQAIDQAGNESTVYDMLIDTTAPTISPLSNYDTPVKAHTWTWTGTDNSGVAPTYRWSMNQTAADTPSGTFSAATSAAVPAQTGKVYIHLQAKDATGNLSPVYHYYVNMDNTRPVIGSCGMVADGSGNWTITPNATDNMSVAANIKYRYAINPSQTYTVTGTYAAGSSFTAQALSGTQYLHLQAIDQAGNESTVYDMLIDTTAPVISPLSNYDTPVKAHTWTWTGTDNSGVAPTYRWSMNQTAADTPSGTFSAATSAAVPAQTGKVYLHLQAKDATGNLSPVYHYYVNMDNTKPTITGLADQTMPVKAYTWNWTGADNAGTTGLTYRHSFSIDAAASPTTTFGSATSAPVTTLNGKVYINVQAKDVAGNLSDVYSCYVHMDNTAPTITGCLLERDPNGLLKITPTVSDNMDIAKIKYRYLLDPGSMANPAGAYKTGSSFTEPFPVGLLYLHIQAIDQAGNESSVYRQLIDLEPPTIPNLADHPTPTKAFTWNWTGVDNAGSANLTYRFSLSPDPVETPATPFASITSVTVAKPNGKVYIHLQAKDASGNLSPIYHYYVNMDNTAPVITDCLMEVDANGMLVLTAVTTENMSTEANLKYRYFIDANPTGTPTGSYTVASPFVRPLPSGTAYLHIQVQDEAGNESMVFSKNIDTVGLDETAPTFDPAKLIWLGERVNPNENIFKSAVTVKIPAEAYSDVNPVTIKYILNGGTEKNYTDAGIQMTADGTYQLKLRLCDTPENVNEVTLNVVVDLEAPQITQVNSTAFPANAWSRLTNGTVSIVASDNRSFIKEYRYTINHSDTDEPVSLKDKVSATDTILLSGLTNGIQYMHVQAVDFAGNVGAPFTYMIQVDSTVPATPVISSETHSISVPGPNTTAHFTWDTPETTGPLGIKEYTYDLKRISGSGTQTPIESGTITGTEKWFNGLTPTAVNETYQFRLFATNPAGTASPMATYAFQVGNPVVSADLVITSTSHPGITDYYSNKTVRFAWNRPWTDHTIPTQFFYQWRKDGEIAEENSWLSVTGQEIQKEFTLSGKYIFYLKAVRGTETKTAQRSVSVDFDAPMSSDFYLNPNPTNLSVDVYWGYVYDLGSGLREIRARLTADGQTLGWKKINPTDTWKTFSGLRNKVQYTLELVIMDQAGNPRTMSASFELGKPVNYNVEQNFHTTVGQWVIEGTKLGQEIRTVKVLVNGYGFEALENGSYVSKTEIPFTTIENNNIFINPDITYQIRLGQTIFTGKGIRLDASGLKLLSIAYNTPSLLWTNLSNTVDEANKQCAFTEVKLSTIPGQIEGSYSTTKNIKFSAGWPITLGTFVLSNSGVNISGQVDLTSVSNIQRPLTLSNLQLTDNTYTSAILQSGYTFTIGSSTLTVVDSMMLNGYIHVKSAYFTFKIGETTQRVNLGNFEIDTRGFITLRTDYYSDAFNYTVDGVNYQFAANKVTMSNGELCMADGVATVVATGETIRVENVNISTSQTTLIQPSPSFGYLEKYVHGIRIEGLAGYQEGNYIVFSEGMITLPIQDEEGVSGILNVLNLKYNVTNSAWDFSQMSIINPVFAFNHLAYVDVEGITTVMNGLKMSGHVTMMDHLPAGLASEQYAINNLVMNGAEGVVLFDAVVPGSKPLSLFNTYQFTTSNLKFRLDGKINSVYFTDCQVKYIGTMAQKLSATDRSAALKIIEVSSDGGVTKFDSSLRNLTFDLAGLQVNLSTHDIDDETITFGGTVVLPAFLPGEFAGQTLTIHELQMDHISGSIINFIVYQDNPVPIKVGNWAFALYSLGITDTEFQFSAGIQVPGKLLPALEGKYIDINRFVLDRETGNVKAFDVNIPLEFSFPLGSGFQISANNLGISLTEGRLESLALGFRYAGLQLPPDLGGGIVSVSDLKVTASGDVSYNSINLTGQHLVYKNVIDIYVQNAAFDDSGLSVNGTVTLGSTFPEGLRGQVFTISSLHVTNQRVDRFQVSTTVTTPIRLFNALEFTPGAISLSDTGIMMENGTVKMIGNAATNITSQTVALNRLSVDYSGKVLIDASFGNFSFNTLGCKVDVTKITFTDTKMSFLGNVTLPAALPGQLCSLQLAIQTLEFNYQGEVANFNIAVNTARIFNIDKVKFTLSSFVVSKTGLGMKGSITLPDTFPGGLANQILAFENIQMGFNGKLLDCDIDFPEMNFNIGTVMKGKLTGLGLQAEYGVPKLVATRLDLTLNAPLTGGISFTNMSLTTAGQFTAQAQPTAQFKIPFAGSELSFAGPSFTNGEVQINTAKLVLPASLGKGSFAVNNVRIHPTNGIRIGGGDFSVKIPEMKVGQVGLQQASLTLKLSGTQYAFEGTCKAQVPGIGQFNAEVKLITISPKYPSGIERIYLSFKSTSPGLPLGTTGLFINGVYGEFADGPIPSDSPDVVRRIGGGMRFNLGIYLRDVSGGFQGNTGFWVNITNTNSAITGDVSMLSNLVSAKAYAAVTNHFKDFYASAQIKVLNCIEGNASFHLWSQNSKTYLTGTSSVRIKVSKGQVVDAWLVKIPSSDWWSPSIGTEFGDFKNNVKGVKGYVSVPLFGQVGMFVGNIGFKIGGVDKYILIDRATIHFAHLVLTPEERIMGLNAVSPELENFIIDDREYVTVRVPGSNQFASMGMQLASATPEQVNNYFVQSTERLVFAVGYKSGNPEIAAIDPSGVAYDQHTPGVEYAKEVGQIVLSIPNPKPGAWHLELADAEGIEYQVAVLGTTPKPEVTFFNNGQFGIQSDGTFQISGYGGVFSGKTAYVDLYYDTDNQGFDGVLIAERVPVTNGNINYNWNLSQVPAGQYYIYGKIYDVENDGSEAMPPALMYAEIPATINPRTIAAPAQVKAAKVGDEVHIGWSTSDNPDVAGYKVYYGTEMGIYPYCSDVGYLSETMLPVLEGSTMYVGVSSYSGNDEESYKTEMAVSLDVPQLTDFHLQNIQIDSTLEALIGQGKTVELPYSAAGGDAQADEQFTASLSGLPAGVNVIFDQQVYQLYNSNQVIKMTLMAEGKTLEIKNELDGTMTIIPAATPGITAVTLTLTSASNSALVLTKTFDLVVKHPQPRVYQAFPKEVIHNLPREITVRGENFRPDARVFLGTTELTTQYVDSFTMIATVPQGAETGQPGITVENPDGQLSQTLDDFTVLKPEYVILPLQPMVTTHHGEAIQLYFTLGGKYDFTGEVQLNAQTLPAGFTVNAVQPVASVGGNAAFTVNVAETVTPGVYTLSFISDAEHTAEVIVHVVEDDIQPQITALNKPFGFADDTIVVYGSGLGVTGTLTLNGDPLITSSWAPNRIEFVLPEGAASGYIVVSTNGRQSAPRYFTVKVKDYSVMYPEQLTIRRGETVPVTVSLIGYSEPIQFDVDMTQAPGLTWGFTGPATDVMPNSELTAILTASTTVERGSYPITLTANTGNPSTSKSFTITVKIETAEIANVRMAEGRVQVPYKDWIEIKNGVAPYEFTLVDGNLPVGLALQEDGTISGLPQEMGTYIFTVEAKDSIHTVSRKGLQIQISRDEWNMVGHDAQGSNYTLQPAPATNQYGELVVLEQAPGILLSNDQHIIAGQGNFVNLYTKTGELIKQLDLTEAAVDGVALTDRYVFVTNSGKLVSYKPDTDPVKDVPVTLVTGFTPKNLYLYRDQVMVTDGTKIQLWDPYAMEMSKEFTLATPANGTVKGILFDGRYYYVSAANELLSVSLTNQQASIKVPYVDTIVQMTAAQGKLIVLTAMGQVHQFDPSTVSGMLWHDLTESMKFVVPYADGVVVGNDTHAITLAYGDKEIVASTQGDFKQVVVAGNRLYSVGIAAVSAYKVAGLQQVWSADLRNAAGLMVCNERLYVATNTSLLAFNGPNNQAAPVSTHGVKSDGIPSNGWYSKDVIVYLYATDRDDEVAGIYYSLNGEPSVRYSEPVTLAEGIQTLQYYAVDQAGMVGETSEPITLKIDKTAPEITLVPLETTGDAQVFELRATDALSGTSFISITIGTVSQTYTGPFTLTPGTYTIFYFANDVAGNYSELHRSIVTVYGAGTEPQIMQLESIPQ